MGGYGSHGAVAMLMLSIFFQDARYGFIVDQVGNGVIELWQTDLAASGQGATGLVVVQHQWRVQCNR